MTSSINWRQLFCVTSFLFSRACDVSKGISNRDCSGFKLELIAGFSYVRGAVRRGAARCGTGSVFRTLAAAAVVRGDGAAAAVIHISSLESYFLLIIARAPCECQGASGFFGGGSVFC